MQAPAPEHLAVEIIRPYLDRTLGPGNFASIDAFRKAFLAKGHTLAEFTTGLKFLLDHKILKRHNDHELGIGAEASHFCQQHFPGTELPG